MRTEQNMVRAFHQKYDCRVGPRENLPAPHEALHRSRMMAEEVVEFLAATDEGDFIEAVDALCDLMYLILGAAVEMGVDLEPCFAEVHRSNMTKTRGHRDSGGKVLKGEDFEPPNLVRVIHEAGEEPSMT